MLCPYSFDTPLHTKPDPALSLAQQGPITLMRAGSGH